MELIKPGTKLNFVGFRYKAFMISGLLFVVGFAALFYRGGLNMGIDFAGGTLIQVQFSRPTNPEEIRKATQHLIEKSTIQQIGATGDNEYLIRADTITTELQSLSQKVSESLNAAYGEGQATVRRVEMVGPKVGQDLRQKAILALYYSLLFMGIYVSGRFEFKWVTSLIMGGVLLVGLYLLTELGANAGYIAYGALVVTLILCWVLKMPYALGALVSLLHDVIVVVGLFAIFDKEFTLEILAALLTLSGFSINDTIVVYDRIREDRNKDRKKPLGITINEAINQTLSRTVLTSGTVFFVLLCLFLFGGTVIHDFAFAMLIGVVAGTYSSIFVAAPIVLLYEDVTNKRRPGRKRAAA